MDEPGRIRRVLPVEPNCELVLHYAAVESENTVGVEQEICIDSIINVSHLAGGSEPASAVLADEGKGVDVVIVWAVGQVYCVGIDASHVDLVLSRGEIQDRIHVRPVNVA